MPEIPVSIGSVLVEVDALRRLRHACDPAICRGGACCCRHYEVCFTRAEMARAVGLMPGAQCYAPHLRPGEALENPFDPVGGGLHAIDTDDDGACAFAFEDAAGTTWCSLHRAALDLGVSPWKTKAQPCVLWPLALSEGRPRVLGVQEDAFRFPCNRRTRRPLKRLDPGVSACVERIFGARFLARLEAVIADREA